MSRSHARSVTRALRWSTLTIVLAFGVFGSWLNYARLDSAAIAGGTLVTKLSTRAIQHPDGGVVGDVLVSEGQLVEEGEVLLRLDPTQIEASSKLFDRQLASALARRARLEAEVGILEEIAFPDEVIAAEGIPEIARAMSDELNQFAIARAALDKNSELLHTQIAQAEEEVRALDLQHRIAAKELELVSVDLKNLQELREKGLANQSRVTELRRDQLTLEGKIAQSEIETARIRQAITGLELEIEKARNEYRQRASEILETVNRSIRSLRRDSVVAADSLRRVEILSPVKGTVQESSGLSVGSVVRAGEVLMKIAPQSSDYVLDVKIGPNDIESLQVGSAAQIRFSAFKTIELPPFPGELTSLSRDKVVDERQGAEYFEGRVRLFEESIPEDIRSRLVAGMSAIVYLPVDERTALEYLLGPILRRVEGAMREE